MTEEYVHKDYHDATMREIKALMDSNLAKQEALIAKQDAIYAEIKGEIKNIHTRIDGVIDTFSVAINDIKESQSNGLTRWGIIVAVVVGVIQVAITLFMR